MARDDAWAPLHPSTGKVDSVTTTKTAGKPTAGGKRRRPSPRHSIPVTRDIIGKAIIRDSSHCMIAEAIKAAIPTAKSIAVDLASVRWSDPDTGLRYTFLTPRRAQVALLDFDQGLTPDPFTLNLKDAIITASKIGKPKERASLPRTAELAIPTGASTTGLTAPVRVGGQPPPLGPLSNATRVGKRRSFGLRLMGR